jgi:hypothetical protein
MRHLLAYFVAACLSAPLVARCDTIEFLNEKNKTEEAEGSIYGTGDGAIVVQKADGSLRIIPDQLVKKRTVAKPEPPMPPARMLEKLKTQFGEELFRGRVTGQYVIGVILQAPLPKSSERRVQAALRKSAGYMTSIARSFDRFVRVAGVEMTKPKHPMVVLIFETDDNFEAFTAEHTGNKGLSAGNIAGFYSQVTNYLYVRMSECYSFATPLHEAIHQLCFNTGVLHRLAPIPVWFSEGMATGFEGAGDQVKSDPRKLSLVYGKIIGKRGLPQGVDWNQVAGGDRLFRGDIFAGEAYLQAWAMHWYFVSKHKKEYGSYLKYLQTLQPLSDVSDRTRRQEFVKAFGKSPNEFQANFAPAFISAMKRIKIPPDRNELPGLISRQQNLAGIEVYGESARGRITVTGNLKNISPIREMAYYIAAISDSGTYTDWYVPKLKINASIKLNSQAATKLLPGSRGGPARGFNILIRSVPADSDENKEWQNGKLPQLQGARR